jgi:hypothetical protein
MSEPADVLDYDKLLLEQLNRAEDRVERLALQYYAAAGAVLLAHFTGKIPVWATAVVVIVLGVNIIWAILSNIGRYDLLWSLHRIVRDHWLAGRSELRDAFRGDAVCETYLTTKALPFKNFLPLIIANLLPILAVLIWWLVLPDGIGRSEPCVSGV